MSGSAKTIATELAVACGILGCVPTKLNLMGVEHVTEEDAEKALAFIRSDKGSKLCTKLWNVGVTIQKQLGVSPVKKVAWTGALRRHAAHVAAEDLRVFLGSGLNATEVSVKVDSNVVHNRSIEWLRLLLEGKDSDVHVRAENWFTKYAPDEQNSYFRAVKGPEITGCSTAEDWYASRAGAQQKSMFAAHCAAIQHENAVAAAYSDFVAAVTAGATSTLNEALKRRAAKNMPLELVFRKLLRLDTHSYIICGTDAGREFASLVPSISEFSANFQVLSVEAVGLGRGQPEVQLKFKLKNRNETRIFEVSFHAELRWSHGKFGGNPEAKIYKDFKYSELPWLVSWPIEHRARTRA